MGSVMKSTIARIEGRMKAAKVLFGTALLRREVEGRAESPPRRLGSLEEARGAGGLRVGGLHVRQRVLGILATPAMKSASSAESAECSSPMYGSIG